MSKKLKPQIFIATIFLVVVFTISGLISIIEYRYFSRSIHSLIEDNYKSIQASKSMLEALEREDSGVLLLLLGDMGESHKILNNADSAFLKAYLIAENNLTETNEEKYVKNIKESYAVFKTKWKQQTIGYNRKGDVMWYKNDIHQSFADTKKAVNSLMDLNQESLYNRASVLKEKSSRAFMPGVVSIIAALVFSVLFNYIIARYLANS
ncbi:MAG: hypothetical protein P1P88_25895 [Bacteroidales bacterium]|nr:hypothetical protein [Bacteroidales bacterium]